MVKIDGAKAKKLRESKGLTQLYVATVVDVTTDTISRWENRRYPSIKKENAEKLAEALEVEMAEIIDYQDQETESFETLVSAPPKKRVRRITPAVFRRVSVFSIFTIITLLVIVLGYLIFNNKEVLPTISAVRILPEHVPAGQPFPVLVKVEVDIAASFSLIIRESLPPGCELLGAEPLLTAAGRGAGLVKWVSRLEGQKRSVAYLVKSSGKETTGEELVFNGQVLAGRQSVQPIKIAGNDRVELADFHWADLNRDNRIDDEEILAIYDLFSELEEFSFNRDQLDEIWASSGYQWNNDKRIYEILP